MKIVAVTSCPMGLAHTYMAEEALKMAAKKMGYTIKVETRGMAGIQNALTKEDIENADAVIIAADTHIDKERFKNKPLIDVPVTDAIKDAKGLLKKAAKAVKKENKMKNGSNDNFKFGHSIYKNMMTAISYAAYLAVIGGVLKGLSKISFLNIKGLSDFANMSFELMLPIFAGFIGLSIGEKGGFAVGTLFGFLCMKDGAGIIGAIIMGFISGYFIKLFKKIFEKIKYLNSLNTIVISPCVAAILLYLAYHFILYKPFKTININFLYSLENANKIVLIILCALLGFMIAFDAGGPVNKVAYTFSLITLSFKMPSVFMAAAVAAGMTPPLGTAIALFARKNMFSERYTSKKWDIIFNGTAFITEGAQPFYEKNIIIKVSCIFGSVLAATLSAFFDCRISVPLGGLYTMIIPNVTLNLALYLAAILLGTIATGILIVIFDKKKMEE